MPRRGKIVRVQQPLEYQRPVSPGVLRPWWIIAAAALLLGAAGLIGLALALAVLKGGFTDFVFAAFAGLIVLAVCLFEYHVLSEFDPDSASIIGWLSAIASLPLLLGSLSTLAHCARLLTHVDSAATLWAFLSGGEFRGVIFMSGITAACLFVTISHFAFARRVRRIARQPLPTPPEAQG